MKDSKKSLFAVLLVTGSLALAQGVVAATDQTQPPKEASMAGIGAGIATMPMHQQMKRMQEQMAKIHEATAPEERRKLMKEHTESMQDMMKMMHGMMAGQGMMGPRHRGMWSPSGNAQGMMNPPCAEGADSDRMARMEQRMNMMQMMMDQVLKAQSEQLDKE